MQERRKLVRRRADRELLEKLREQASPIAGNDVSAIKAVERDRRRAIRHECKVHIKMVIRCAAGLSDEWSVDEFEVKGRLLDLSIEGAAVLTKQNFEVAQQLRLTILVPDGDPIATTGTVRWVKSVPKKNAFASGVKFKGLSDDGLKTIKAFLDRLDTMGTS